MVHGQHEPSGPEAETSVNFYFEQAHQIVTANIKDHSVCTRTSVGGDIIDSEVDPA